MKETREEKEEEEWEKKLVEERSYENPEMKDMLAEKGEG